MIVLIEEGAFNGIPMPGKSSNGDSLLANKQIKGLLSKNFIEWLTNNQFDNSKCSSCKNLTFSL